MRIFIAVDIDSDMRDAVAKLQKRLQAELKLDKKAARWVRPDAMHLTLKFLGEVKDQAVNDVCEIVKQVAGSHKPFDLNIEKLGCFGGKSARVLWVAAGVGSTQLEAMAFELDERLGELGFSPKTRRFTGHLTLCRIKDYKAGVVLAEKAATLADFDAGLTHIDSLKVYQSQLTPTGPIYTALVKCKLKIN